MKTKEELNEIKEETEILSKKLNELTDEELAQVTGGNIEQELKNLAKQHFLLEKESTGEKFKDFLEKYARYYKNILPKK